MKYLIGAAALILIVVTSGYMATYVISGVLMFAGLIALCESVPVIRWIFSKTSTLVDIAMFAFSIYGLQTMGVTAAIGISVCGLLFSIYYKPILKLSK